ncbi:ATP-binding cassette protein C4-like protein, partial [Leptotrombidium deliense]
MPYTKVLNHNYLKEFISVVQPLLIGTIIRYFSSKDLVNNVTATDARNASIMLCFSLCFQSIIRNHFYIHTQRIAIRVKTAISVLVFEKILRIRQTTTETSVGQILNLFTNDLNKFD